VKVLVNAIDMVDQMSYRGKVDATTITRGKYIQFFNNGSLSQSLQKASRRQARTHI
jgi:hypothetical protein